MVGDGSNATIERQGDETDRDVERDRSELRAPDAERRDHHEARGEGADDRAHGVRSVEPRQTLSELRVLLDEQARDDRQRGAHQEGGQHQGDEGERATERDESGIDAAVPFREREIERVDGAHQRRQHERECADPELQQRVDPQRSIEAPGQATGDEAAEGHAAHEGREDDARRLEARAEDQRQVPEPGHLVDEPGRTRCDEERVRETMIEAVHGTENPQAR